MIRPSPSNFSARMDTKPPTAAILLIGDEILSGKVEDENARYLVRELRRSGVTVGRIEVVPDQLEVIAESVRRLAAGFDWVFSSGGVGPTHDDVTLPAVAAAFDRAMERNAELERLMRKSWGDHVHPRDLRMADVPVGARLEYGPGGGAAIWPVVVVNNVWILPGVPKIFRKKFEAIHELFRGPEIYARAVYSAAPEGAIADALDAVVGAFPTVAVGSYPHLDAVDYQVKITLDGRDQRAVEDATARLAERLGTALVRTE
jgi:molybdenum cofactor synthesis domain-containing protein